MMIAFFRFEWSRIFTDRRNLVFFSLVALSAGYFVWSGTAEHRRSLADKNLFVAFEKEKTGQIANYTQYAAFGFRVLYEAAPLHLFFVNSGVLQDLESNVDGFEAIRAESSFKGDKLFLMRGYFKDFAGILFVFGSLLMLYFGHAALVSPAYLHCLASRLPLSRHFLLTTAARLFWLDLFFLVLSLGLFAGVQASGISFSIPERRAFFLFLLFLLLFLNFLYLLGQLTTVATGFRKTFFLWLFLVWFACIFLLPELGRISVFKESQSLEPAEKVNLEKFRNLMAIEQRFRDYLRANPKTSLDQIRRMQKEFALQFRNSSYLVNTALEIRYLRKVERVIAGHERLAILFPTTFYLFLSGEVSGKGYSGYLDFMDYVIRLRGRFLRFFMERRYGSNYAPMESFVKGGENVYRARVRLPRHFLAGLLLTALYAALLLLATYGCLRRRLQGP